MQLSLSTASLDTIPVPQPNVSDAPKKTAPDQDGRKSSDFDDLLPRNAEKPKPTSSSTKDSPKKAHHKKSVSTDPLDESKTGLGATPDASSSADVASMMAFLAGATVIDPKTVSLTGPQAGDVPGTIEGDLPATASGDGCEPVAGGTTAGLPGSVMSWSIPAGSMSPIPGVPVPSAPVAADNMVASKRALKPGEISGVALESPTGLEPVLVAADAQPNGVRPPVATATGQRRASTVLPSASSAREANLAGPPADSSIPEKGKGKVSLSNFLDSHKDEVTKVDQDLGTGIAKPSSTMAAVPFSHRQFGTAESAVLSAQTVNQADASPSTIASQLNDAASVAHRAVDAVMSAAERVSTERNSVDLQFSLGGNDLAVRVEFRGGTVHATFKTDSAELRAALSNEWSAAGSKMTDASVRMAPPVFTSSNAGSSTSFSGQGAQQQAQRDASSQASSAGLFALNQARSARAGSSDVSTPVMAPRAVVSTALHLHTFA